MAFYLIAMNIVTLIQRKHLSTSVSFAPFLKQIQTSNKWDLKSDPLQLNRQLKKICRIQSKTRTVNHGEKKNKKSLIYNTVFLFIHKKRHVVMKLS